MRSETIVRFRTNLDQYTGEDFADSFGFDIVPRTGDFIEVRRDRILKFESKRLPTRLEVVSVTWHLSDSGRPEATVELWYNKTDLELAKMANAPVFG